MKRLIHYLNLVYENRLSFLSVFIVCTAISFVISFSFSLEKKYNIYSESVRVTGLDKAVRIEDRYGLTAEDIKAVGNVDKIHSVDCNISLLREKESDTTGFAAVSYSLDNGDDIIPIRLDDGSYIEKLEANELVLSNDLKSTFSIGEIVCFNVYITDDSQQTYCYKDMAFTIKGFFDDKQFPVAGGHITYPRDITAFFYQDNDSFAIYNFLDPRDQDLYKLEYRNDTKGTEIDFTPENRDSKTLLKNEFWIVYPKYGKTDAFIKNFRTMYPDSTCYSYDVLNRNFINSRSEEYHMLRSLSFVGVLSLFIILITSLGMTIAKRKGDMVIFHMLGATWRYSVLSVFSTHFLAFLLGSMLGLKVSKYITIHTLGERFILSISENIRYCLVVLMVYMVFIVSFYILVRKKHAIELYRETEI